MSRIRRRFATLRWRLMLSFFVAVWAGMMTLATLFFFVPTLVAMSSPQRPIALVQNLGKLAPRLAPDVAQSPPDGAHLTATLATFDQPLLIPERITDSLSDNVAVIPGQNAALFVVGTDGTLLAALPAHAHAASDLANIQRTATARAVVTAALHSGTPATGLIRSTDAGQTVAAVPILDTHGVARGALLIGVDLAAMVRPIYLNSLLALVPTAILFGILAGIFGSIFGLITARKLTRRLERLTVAADAWSHGDFAATARDLSDDELGQLARDLNRMADELRTLLQDRAQLAVAEERNRLARDLHDSVKQQLFALTMLLGSAQLEAQDSPEAQRILAEAERTVTSAQQEMTALISALRPIALAHKDLSAALRDLCREWSTRSGIPCAAQIADHLALSPSAEQEVFRTVQEALSNVGRHSGATRVEVRADVTEMVTEHMIEKVLDLRVRDNGHGFDVGQADGSGLGLRSMRERIEGLGGRLAVSSSVGGTRIEMRVPLASPGSVGASVEPRPGQPVAADGTVAHGAARQETPAREEG